MRIRTLGCLLWLAGAGTLSADFRIEGGANRDFLETAGVVAVLPAICPSNVDCAWLDRKVAGEILRRKRPKFLSAAAAREALTAMGASELSEEIRVPLASGLGAQTLLEIRVRELEKVRARETREPDERQPEAREKYDRGDGNAGDVRGKLEIRAISAETGRTVAEGTAIGDAPTLSEKKLLGPMLAQLLDRMFPLPR